MSKIMSLAEAKKYAQRIRTPQFFGRALVVTTNGCFSILHVGHVDLLRKARQLGGCLIVLINSDAGLPKYTGHPSIVSERDRAEVLAGLACVDAVVIFDGLTPARALAQLKPDIHVKGGDYKANDLPEKDAVHRNGGMVITIAHKYNESTSRILKRLREE